MKTLLFLLLTAGVFKANAQTFITRNGYLGFFSKTPLENIKAENNQVYAVIDTDKKNMAFTCLIKGFLFAKELMQEHFNENYAESDKYPKANFLGTYSGNVDVSKNGVYPVQVTGQLTFHGVTKNITIPATIEVKDNKVMGKSNFKLAPADFNITIPSLVREKIEKEMDVQVLVACNPK